MPIYLTQPGEHPPTYISDIKHNPADKSISISLNNNGTLRQNMPIDLSKGENPQGYSYRLFRNKFLRESDIYQVHEGQKKDKIRIGWLIPLTALESDSHQYGTNPYFIHYTKAALFALWLPANNIYIQTTKAQQILDTGLITIADIYLEDTAVLMIDNRATADIHEFSVHNYTHCLFKYGYSSYGIHSHPAENGSRAELMLRQLQKELRIQRISKHLESDAFLRSILCGIAELRSHPLASFLILYQVFELLIERVFRNERSALLEHIRNKESLDEIRDATQKLRDAINEENRLNKLYSLSYMVELPDHSYVCDACRDFLTIMGRTPENGLVSHLYSTRNTIVHNFRRASPDAQSAISRINSELMVFIVDVATNYKELPPIDPPVNLAYSIYLDRTSHIPPPGTAP